MTTADQAEIIMKEHLGLVPPWDRPWKLRAFELVMTNLVPIAASMDQGLCIITDPRRRDVIAKHLGDQNGTEHRHYGFNVWLLNECLGPRMVGGQAIFLRCLTCQKIRTGAGMDKSGPCKCGSTRLSNAIGQMNTRRAMGFLASGY